MTNLRYRLARGLVHLANAIGNIANWLDDDALEDLYNEYVEHVRQQGRLNG